MCGFCLSTAGRPQAHDRIEQVLEPRGPDGRGEVSVDGTWLLHRRLAIIDPTEGSAQPFRVGDAAVGFNGEIYNYAALNRLEDSRHEAKGDTETISRRLARGERLDPLRGMYAAASTEGSTVRLTRDRFGIKPLYRAVDASGDLHIASQLRCFQHLLPTVTVDQEAVSCFLRFGSVIGPRTILREVGEVEPGTTETWQDGVLTSVERLAPIAGCGDLGGALHRSMERHLVADTDVAVLLSAGLDSAILACLARDLGADPITVTVSTGGQSDESEGAARTAKKYGLRHEVVRVSGNDALEAIDEYLLSMDQPTVDGFNTFLVTRAVRSLGVPVAISGLGADELFGGYSSFRNSYLTHKLRHLPPQLLAGIVNRQSANRRKTDRWIAARRDLGALALINREVFAPDECPFDLEAFAGPLPALGDADEVLRTEVWRYMVPRLLRDSDAFSMANSVELRVPFLDDEVAGAAMARTTRQRALQGKGALVECLSDPHLEKVHKRKKTGFDLPLDQWMSGPLKERYAAATSDVSARLNLTEGPSSRRWAMLCLSEWLQRHRGS